MTRSPALTLLLAALLCWTGCRRAPGAGSAPRSAASAAPAASLSARTTGTCPIYVPPQAGDNATRLQGALDAAAAGDCGDVLLGPGSFEISRPLQLRSGVRLKGQRFRRTFSIVRPSREFKGRALLLTQFAPGTAERKQREFYVENLRLDAAPACPSKKNCAPANATVGLWLENTAYPTIRECEFSRFPDGGAAIRGSGILYLKLLDSRFLSNLGWSVDLALEYSPKREGSEKPSTYYAVSVGTIQGNYFAARRGIRLTPVYQVTIRDNQFEGGLSMIHAYEAASSVLAIENNYFEVSKTPQDVEGRGTIAVNGTARVVGNLINGPPKGKLLSYPGPGIEVVSSASVTIEDNTIRCFDPAVRVGGVVPANLRDRGNVVAPREHVSVPWDFPQRRLVESDEAAPAAD